MHTHTHVYKTPDINIYILKFSKQTGLSLPKAIDISKLNMIIIVILIDFTNYLSYKQLILIYKPTYKVVLSLRRAV